MKHLLATVIMLLASAFALAEVQVKPLPAPVPGPTPAPPAVVPPPPCWPKPFGTGTAFKTNSSADGVWAWWYCSDKYKYDPYFVAVTDAAFNSSKVYESIATLLASPAQGKTLGALWTANVKADPTLQPLYAAAKFDYLGDHVVAPNQVPNQNLKTRPTYPVINGKKGPISNGTAKVGETCDCRKTRIISVYAYCEVPVAVAGQVSMLTPTVTVCEPTFK